jgi:hypothetical protein
MTTPAKRKKRRNETISDEAMVRKAQEIATKGVKAKKPNIATPKKERGIERRSRRCGCALPRSPDQV